MGLAGGAAEYDEIYKVILKKLALKANVTSLCDVAKEEERLGLSGSDLEAVGGEASIGAWTRRLPPGILVGMGVTISIDEEILARARQLAQRQGKSLDELIGVTLAALTTDDSRGTLEKLQLLWSAGEGDSGGWKWNREEPYDRPVLR